MNALVEILLIPSQNHLSFTTSSICRSQTHLFNTFLDLTALYLLRSQTHQFDSLLDLTALHLLRSVVLLVLRIYPGIFGRFSSFPSAAMAPSAISPPPHADRDGPALEELSDNIDTVNVLKAALKASTAAKQQQQSEKVISDKSEWEAEKDKTQFRQYESACDRVRNFYKEQHEKQTVAFNLKAREDFRSKTRAKMTIWEAMEKLNTLIDDSDPDTSLSQIEHLLQSAEAIRRDGKPR